MRVAQRTDHVLRALTHLAQYRWGEPVPTGTVAEELGLPRRFLEQQFGMLAKAGILQCRRGAGGGCELARPAEDITVKDVVVALDGEVLDVPHVSGSAASAFWAEIRLMLERRLDDVSLADLAARQDREDAVASEPMYYI